MSLKDLAQIVSKAAPALGAAILGPAGGLVGSLVASFFGGNIKDVPDLINKISSDPEAMSKLLKIQNDHEENLSKLSIEKFEAESGDRDSARKRETETKDWMPKALGLSAVFGFYSVIAGLVFIDHVLNDSQIHIVDMLLGYLCANFTQVYQYYFGGNVPKLRKK